MRKREKVMRAATEEIVETFGAENPETQAIILINGHGHDMDMAMLNVFGMLWEKYGRKQWSVAEADPNLDTPMVRQAVERLVRDKGNENVWLTVKNAKSHAGMFWEARFKDILKNTQASGRRMYIFSDCISKENIRQAVPFLKACGRMQKAGLPLYLALAGNREVFEELKGMDGLEFLKNAKGIDMSGWRQR